MPLYIITSECLQKASAKLKKLNNTGLKTFSLQTSTESVEQNSGIFAFVHFTPSSN